MKPCQSLTVAILILILPGLVYAEYRIEWSSCYTDVKSNADNLCMATAPSGDYSMAYALKGDLILENLTYDGSAQYHDVDSLSSSYHAYSALTYWNNYPYISFSDLGSDGITIRIFHDNFWHYRTMMPESSRITALRSKCRNSVEYTGYTIQDGSDRSFLKLLHNADGPWETDLLVEIGSSNMNNVFDMEIAPDGSLYIVYVDRPDQKLQLVVRSNTGDYTFSDIATGIGFCTWVNLEFMAPDIPVVGFLLKPYGENAAVKVGMNLGYGWAFENVYEASDIDCVDMCLDNSGDFITPNWCFLVHANSNYHCINRSYPYWNHTVLDWSAITPAEEIKLEWNEANDEFGAFIHTPETNRIWFLTGYATNSTPTPHPTSTPTPVDPPTKTPTPFEPPTKTPTPHDPPTKTPTPHDPPTKTPTPLSTRTPTPTPYSCSELGVTIEMPATSFRPGDLFYCNLHSCNPGSTALTGVPLFLILDVYGEFFFGPSFSSFDYFLISMAPGGVTATEAIPAFYWPEVDHGYTNIWFYAGMTDADITQLLGEMDSVMFEWSI